MMTVLVAINAFTFLLYAADKYAAIHNQWRIAERHLHGASLAGGWPAAFAAQRILRHKNRKASFQHMYWVTVGANIFIALALYSILEV